jgi:integrase
MAAEDALQESRGLGVREPVQGGQETLGALERGATPYHSAAIRCGIGRIGWHSFRHYSGSRTLLDETGAPMKVQQELTRHADIRTAMNVCGKAMDAGKREAHGKVVRVVLAAKVA